jgi:hypothetical protein
VNGTTYLNGATTVNSSLAVNGDLTVQDGYSIRFGSGGADGRIYRTGGQVYIEADDYIYFKSTFGGANAYFNQGTLYTPSSLLSDGSLSVATTATIGGLLRARQYFNYGETVSYQTGYNATPGADGYFWTTNGFWQSIGTASYLSIAINATGVSAVWYGRAYLSPTGGSYNVICDYRNPDNNNGNQISVQDFWGSYGANALKITILNPNYGASFIVKVSG